MTSSRSEPRTRICESCHEVYSGTVSCPSCDHVPRTERMDYVPPVPCDPWRAELTFDDCEINMTVRHSGQRQLLHKIMRLKGGGPA